MQSLKILMAGALFCSSPVRADNTTNRKERLAGVLQAAISEEQIGQIITRSNNIEIKADKVIFITGTAGNESPILGVSAERFISASFVIVKYGDTFQLVDQTELDKIDRGETLEDKVRRVCVSLSDFKDALRLARNRQFLDNIARQLPKES